MNYLLSQSDRLARQVRTNDAIMVMWSGMQSGMLCYLMSERLWRHMSVAEGVGA
jgi:phage gp37-like protein